MRSAIAIAPNRLLRRGGHVVETAFASCGADDFAYYGAGPQGAGSQGSGGHGTAVPSVMMFAGSGTPVSLHHPEFLPADRVIGDVASAMLAGYLAALAIG